MVKINYNKIIISLLTLFILVHLLAGALLYFYQEKMLFPGTKLSQSHQYQFDLPFKEVDIPVDGAIINALHFTQENSKGLVFFLHGNTGNLEKWTTGVDYYQRVNYDLFIFDYRGYGKSTSQIENQQQLHDDVRVAWDFIQNKYPNKPIVIYGRSLGTGLAVELARHVTADLLVLVSPYKSMLSMAKKRFPVMPEFIMRYPLRSDQLIGDVETPTAFFHGSEDTLISDSHSEILKSLMNIDAKLFIVDGAGHGDIHQFSAYTDNLTALLMSL